MEGVIFYNVVHQIQSTLIQYSKSLLFFLSYKLKLILDTF